jgi:hypothetical protein
MKLRVSGWGAVSPAGWTAGELSEAIRAGQPLPVVQEQRPGWERPLSLRRVPAPPVRAAFQAHPRLRRTSAITHHVVSAAIEALGGDPKQLPVPAHRLGVVLCVMAGCVSYSRRFFAELSADPSTASPLVFPETVFNAPASHLAAFLGSDAVSYTLVGNPGMYLQGVALAAHWLAEGRIDACLVIGAEETDWMLSDAWRHFDRSTPLAEGAGALLLQNASEGASEGVFLEAVTDCHRGSGAAAWKNVARQMRAELPAGAAGELLFLSTRGRPVRDRAELEAWEDWPGARLAPKRILGEGLMAGVAWQCAAACAALARGAGAAANVSIVGPDIEAVGARFVRRPSV